jgi:hypothetical protein
MGTVFWVSEGCILVEFLLKRETINMAHYVQMLKKTDVPFVKSA